MLIVARCSAIPQQDGLGGCNKMDDANVPSLLSIPYLDPDASGYNRSIWEATYAWVWSAENPYFFRGTIATGIGSPHTPARQVWPMSQIVRGLVDPARADAMRAAVRRAADAGGGSVAHLHESVHADDPKRTTRVDFGWVDALFAELVGNAEGDSGGKATGNPGKQYTPGMGGGNAAKHAADVAAWYKRGGKG